MSDYCGLEMINLHCFCYAEPFVFFGISDFASGIKLQVCKRHLPARDCLPHLFFSVK